MNLRLTILGREIAAITTDQPEPQAFTAPTREDREREFAEWKARSDTNNGEFGFGRTDLTAIEEPERRWETGQRGDGV